MCFFLFHKDNNDLLQPSAHQIQMGRFTFHSYPGLLGKRQRTKPTTKHTNGEIWNALPQFTRGFFFVVLRHKANEVYEAQNSDFHPFVYLNTADLRTQRMEIGYII